MKTIIKYTDDFKNKVLDEMESGKLKSITDAKHTYGIFGSATIPNWIKKYRREKLYTKVVVRDASW
ncbi:MAG: transposase [bacterium]|nr:transposase [bacterium]